MNDRERLNSISEAIIGAAIAVHKVIGPGLLESAYEACLAYELRQRGIKVEQQKELPLKYREVELECGYRLDLLVEDCVIVEVKSAEGILPIHQAQLMSCLRLTKCRLGLIINFNVGQLARGIKRVVNDFPDSAVSANSAVSGV